MSATTAGSLLEHFADLTDPRVERTKLHQLLDVLVIAMCATICGAEGWEDICRAPAVVALIIISSRMFLGVR